MMIRNSISRLKRRGRMPPSHLSKILSRSLVHTDWNTTKDFFHYTRARFVSNEAHELAIRCVEFDMNELAKSAAESIGLTLAQCVHIEKFPDGMFNKSFHNAGRYASSRESPKPKCWAGSLYHCQRSRNDGFCKNRLSLFLISPLTCHSRSEMSWALQYPRC